jgi:hypothetical protein
MISLITKLNIAQLSVGLPLEMFLKSLFLWVELADSGNALCQHRVEQFFY